MRLGQLLIWRRFCRIDIRHCVRIRHLRLGSMEVGELREPLQPAHGDVLGAIGKRVTTTRSDLHHTLGRYGQQPGLVQISPSPAHTVVDYSLVARGQAFLAFLIGKLELIGNPLTQYAELQWRTVLHRCQYRAHDALKVRNRHHHSLSVIATL
ncbi:hypothetical protein D9M70_511120 [compost metagenome]